VASASSSQTFSEVDRRNLNQRMLETDLQSMPARNEAVQRKLPVVVDHGLTSAVHAFDVHRSSDKVYIVGRNLSENLSPPGDRAGAKLEVDLDAASHIQQTWVPRHNGAGAGGARPISAVDEEISDEPSPHARSPRGLRDSVT
jgi:hypothetical protein